MALLAERTQAAGLPVALVNASISGETTRGGLRRLNDVLARQRPDVVILELGGNDGLRGYPIGQIHSNLNEMVNIIRATGAEVLLVSIPSLLTTDLATCAHSKELLRPWPQRKGFASSPSPDRFYRLTRT